jgi:hypothetical protein
MHEICRIPAGFTLRFDPLAIAETRQMHAVLATEPLSRSRVAGNSVAFVGARAARR